MSKFIGPRTRIGAARANLHGRERAFVRYYLSGDYGVRGNAKGAALAAGYSPNTPTMGNSLLKRPRIQEAISAYYALHHVTANRVMAELSKVAFSDMRDYAEWGPNGVSLKTSAGLDDEAAAAVAEVSEVQGEKSSSLKFKLHNKVEALTTLGRALKLFEEGARIDKAIIVQWLEPGSSPSPTPLAHCNESGTTPSTTSSLALPALSPTDDLANL